MGMMRKSGIITESTAAPYPLKVGLDASKPVPRVGDTYLTTDTGKTYTCYVTGYWTIQSSQGYEEYQNHNGTIDNFLTTSSGGNGVGATDAANHEYDLSSGAGVLGYHALYTKDAYTPAANKRLWGQFKVKNHVNGTKGAGSIPTTWIGFTSNVSTLAAAYLATFFCDEFGSWGALTRNNIINTITAITTPSSGDVLSISMTPEVVQFYKNGSLLVQNTTEIPTQPMNLAASVICEGVAMVAARTMSIDYIMIRQY